MCESPPHNLYFTPACSFHACTRSGVSTAPLKFFGMGANLMRSGLEPLETAPDATAALAATRRAAAAASWLASSAGGASAAAAPRSSIVAQQVSSCSLSRRSPTTATSTSSEP
eukprot:scaffold31179_cov63-Phaeocystis_antarctica.AAC.4